MIQANPVAFWRPILGTVVILGVLWFLARRAAAQAVPDVEIVFDWKEGCDAELRDRVIEDLLKELERVKSNAGIEHGGIDERESRVRIYAYGRDSETMERELRKIVASLAGAKSDVVVTRKAR